MCVARDEVGHSSHRLGLVGSVIPRLARSLTLARRRWSKRVLQRHGHECDPATRECSVWHIDHEEQLLATAQLDAEVAEALQRAELEALLRKGVHPLVLGIACAHTAQSCEAEEDLDGSCCCETHNAHAVNILTSSLSTLLSQRSTGCISCKQNSRAGYTITVVRLDHAENASVSGETLAHNHVRDDDVRPSRAIT